MLEEIVGEIEDEFDEKRRRERASTRWPTAASASPATPTIAAVNEAFDVALPTDEFDTIGGLVAHELGRVPRRGEAVDVGGLRFAVMLTRGGAVRWFKVTRAARRRRHGRRRRLMRPARRASRGRWRAAADAGLRAVLGALSASPSCRPRPGALQIACARRCWPGAWRARRRRARAALLGWAFGIGLARRRHLVAVRQHAPLRRPAGAAGGAGGARAGGCAVALPRRWRWRWSRAGAAAARWRDALLFAAAWLLAELARGVLFTGFPWVASGYAHVDCAAGGAARRGSASTASARSAPALGGRVRRCAAAPRRAPGSRRRRAAGALVARRAARPRRLHAGRPARCTVTLLQGNVPQDEKFAAAARARGAGLAAPAAARGARRARRRRRRPRSRCCRRSSTTALLARRCARAFARGGRAALVGLPLGDYDARLHQLGRRPLGATRRCRRLLPLRQAPPGAVRRVHPARLPLVHATDEHPARRLQPRRARRSRRSRSPASASRPTSATRTCSARSWRRASSTAAQAPTMLANVSNIGWFGDTIALDAAPADLAHARARVRSGRCCAPPTPAPPRSSTTAAASSHALPPFTRGVLEATVEGRSGMTPFAAWAGRFGLWPLWALGARLLGAASPRGARAAPKIAASAARRRALAGLRRRPAARCSSFQQIILRLQAYWDEQGCALLQPYDMEVGAGTFHTATFLRALGPEPWKAAYVQPSPPPEGRPLRREPEPPAALLPVPGGAEAVAGRHPRPLPRLARGARLRPARATTSASSRTTGRTRRSAPGAWAGKSG